MRNKKSQLNIAQGIIGIFTVLLVLAFVLTFSQIFNSHLSNQLKNTTTLNDNTETMLDNFEEKYNWDDKAFIVIYVVLLLSSAFLASKIKYSNWFYIGIFFIVLLSFFYGLVIQDIWETFTDNPLISSSISNYPVKDFILSNPHYFIAVQLVLIFLVIYYQRKVTD